MQYCKTVTLRTRPIKNGMLSFYLDYYPGYRDIVTMIGTTTINAFNHSERIRKAKTYIHCDTKPLKEILINNDTFSTGSFPRIEVNHGHGIMLTQVSDLGIRQFGRML